MTPLITEGLVGSLMHGDLDAPSHELTARQREVLQLLAEGRSMKEVAQLLNLTPRTVAFHKSRIMEQLKVKSSAEPSSMPSNTTSSDSRPGPALEQTRVLLVDDNQAMLARAAASLATTCVIVGQVQNGDDASWLRRHCSRT